jgi:hypothetical protein
MVPMVEEDEEIVVFKLWSCSSTSISLERGLEGTLADLRWQAMAVVVEAVVLSFSQEVEKKRSCSAAAMVSVQPWLASIYNRASCINAIADLVETA